MRIVLTDITANPRKLHLILHYQKGRFNKSVAALRLALAKVSSREKAELVRKVERVR